jgi:hypothetical protein
MLQLIVIDGLPDIEKTALAQDLSHRLGWPLVACEPDGTDASPEGPDPRALVYGGPAVAVGSGAIARHFPDACWKFFLAADPKRAAVGAPSPDASDPAQAFRATLLPPGNDVILIDVTDFPSQRLAAMIAAVVAGEQD